MDRRKFLLAGSASLAVAIAGCSDNGDENGDEPEPDPDENGDGDDDDNGEATPAPEPEEDFPGFDEDAFQSALEDDLGLTVLTFDRSDQRINLDYETETSGESDLQDEFEEVAIEFAGAVEDVEEFDEFVSSLDTTIEAGDDLYGSDFETDATVDYVNEEIDEDEYRELARDSFFTF